MIFSKRCDYMLVLINYIIIFYNRNHFLSLLILIYIYLICLKSCGAYRDDHFKRRPTFYSIIVNFYFYLVNLFT